MFVPRIRRDVFSLTLVFAMFSVVLTPAVVAAEGDAAKGAQVYEAQKCSICHMVNGKGGKMGGDLSDIGSKHDAEWFAKYLVNPKVMDPENKMPAVKVKGQDLEDLIAHLLTLKAE